MSDTGGAGRTGVAAAPAPRRGRWRRRLLISAAISATLLGAVVGAASCRPRWYRPVAIDYSRLDDDKRALVNLGDRIGDALNAGRPIDVELSAEQVNRWLAARRELPEAERFRSENLEQPFVEFLDLNRVRLAATARARGVSAVVSFILRVELESDRVALRLESMAMGALPVPSGALLEELKRASATAGSGDTTIAGDTILLLNEWTWPNGRRRYAVESINVRTGVLTLRLSPR